MSLFENAMKRADKVIFDTFSNVETYFIDGTTYQIKGIMTKEFAEDFDVPGYIPVFSYQKEYYPSPVVGMQLRTSAGNFEVTAINDNLSGEINLHLREI